MTRLFHFNVCAVAFVVGCHATVAERVRPVTCGAESAKAGGEYLETDDGALLWYRVAGHGDGPPVVYLHGGPGYNSYDFEQAVGALLEPHLWMVYLDQRGCGRSLVPGAKTRFGMQQTVADLEALRRRLGVPALDLIGHSFGGVVALEYLKAHPDRVRRLLLVDISADVAADFAFQVSSLASSFPGKKDRLDAIARGGDTPFEKLMAAYGAVSPPAAVRALTFATEDGYARNGQWDAASGLMREECAPRAAVEGYVADGSLDSHHPELMRPLPVPAILFEGRLSRVVGSDNIDAAGKAWHIPVRWFEHSGHFIFVEESETFARATVEFFGGGSLTLDRHNVAHEGNPE